jgi:hypothetical protein
MARALKGSIQTRYLKYVPKTTKKTTKKPTTKKSTTTKKTTVSPEVQKDYKAIQAATKPTEDIYARREAGTFTPTPAKELAEKVVQAAQPSPEVMKDYGAIKKTVAPKEVSPMTPVEQRAAQGGGIPATIIPYGKPISMAGPPSMGGMGTPTELRAGFGYGASSYQWTEEPSVLGKIRAGENATYGGDTAAQGVANLINELGVWPSFFTPHVASQLGLDEQTLADLGYVPGPGGNWIKGDWGVGGDVAGDGWSEAPTIRSSRIGSSRTSGGYASYTGLINWRIGL